MRCCRRAARPRRYMRITFRSAPAAVSEPEGDARPVDRLSGTRHIGGGERR